MPIKEDSIDRLDNMARRLGLRIHPTSLKVSESEELWYAVVETYEYRTGRKIEGGRYSAVGLTGRDALLKAYMAVIKNPRPNLEEDES